MPDLDLEFGAVVDVACPEHAVDVASSFFMRTDYQECLEMQRVRLNDDRERAWILPTLAVTVQVCCRRIRQ